MPSPRRRSTGKHDGDESDAGSIILGVTETESRKKGPGASRASAVGSSTSTRHPTPKAIGKRKERPEELCFVDVPPRIVDVPGRSSVAASSGRAPNKRQRLMFAYVDVPRLSAKELSEYKVFEEPTAPRRSAASRVILPSRPTAALPSLSTPPRTSTPASGPPSSRARRDRRAIAAEAPTASKKRKSIADEDQRSNGSVALGDVDSGSEYGRRRPVKKARLSEPSAKEGGRAGRRTPKRRRLTAGEVKDSDDESYSPRKKAASPRSKSKPAKNVDNDAGVRISCHQCRRCYYARRMTCTTCTKTYCESCVRRRYDFPFIPDAPNFSCPKCLEYCNCDFCMAARGTWERLNEMLGRNGNGNQVRLAHVAGNAGVTAQNWLRMHGFVVEGGFVGDAEEGNGADAENADEDEDGESRFDSVSIELGVPPSLSPRDESAEWSNNEEDEEDEDEFNPDMYSPRSHSSADESARPDRKGKAVKRPRPVPSSSADGSLAGASHPQSHGSSKPPSLTRLWEYSSDSQVSRLETPRHGGPSVLPPEAAHTEAEEEEDEPLINLPSTVSGKPGPQLVPNSPPYTLTSRLRPEHYTPLYGAYPAADDDGLFDLGMGMGGFVEQYHVMEMEMDMFIPHWNGLKHDADLGATLTPALEIEGIEGGMYEEVETGVSTRWAY